MSATEADFDLREIRPLPRNIEAIKLLGIMQREQIPLLEDLDTSGGRWSLTHG